MMRDYTEAEIKRLESLELKTFENSQELYNEICCCIVETDGNIDIWKSNNTYFDDGRACWCVSSDSIDVIYEIIIYDNSFDDENDESIKVLSVC